MDIDGIWLWLGELESRIAHLPRGGLDYQTALALYRRLDGLTTYVDGFLVCAAPDYPDTDEEEDDDE